MNDLTHARIDTLTAGEHHFIVPDVRCAGCCLTIEKELARLGDISGVNVNYAEKRLSFHAATETATAAALDRLTELGYSSAPEISNEGLKQYREERRRLLARLGVAGIGMMQVMMFALASYLGGPDGIGEAYQGLMRWASLVIAIPVTFYSAMPFHRGALRDVKNLSPGMDVPVSLAILSAFSLSTWNTLFQSGEVFFDSACMFTFFLLTGRYLELTARHAFHVDQSLGEHLLPELATDLDGRPVAVTALRRDDLVRIEAGEVVPADAIVIEGTASVDESAFTGEGSPVLKTIGSKVLAGTKNLDGAFEARVLSSMDDWVITHLSDLYRKSGTYRPAFAVLADVIARYFVSVILTLAVASGVFWWYMGSDEYFAIALSVLVVSCPCALSLATPVAYTIASGAVRNLGILISDGSFLEKLSRVNAIVFDKTGTLTEGSLRLEQIVQIDHVFSREEVLRLAASLEVASLHPVAVTLRSEADDIVSVDALEVNAGLGVSGTIENRSWKLGKPAFAAAGENIAPDQNFNWVLLARDDHPVAWFGFSDRLREGADTVISETKQRIPAVTVFSGDSSSAGRERLLQLGIVEPVMDMTPDAKIAGLREIQSNGGRVLMVGDGLNDAGAMAVADISLAVNPVDTVVQSAADATLVGGDLGSVPALFDYACRVRRVIRQNLTWAFAYNLAVIPLAVMGLIAPWVAALGMSASSLFVTLNATRLARAVAQRGVPPLQSGQASSHSLRPA